MRRNRLGGLALASLLCLTLPATGAAHAVGSGTAAAPTSAGEVTAGNAAPDNQTTSASAAQRPTAAGRYIVSLGGLAPAALSPSARRAAASSPAAASAARLMEQARVARVDHTVSNLTATLGITPGTRYHYALQGFAASLSAAQVAALRADPQVLALTLVRPVSLAAEETPTGVMRVGADPTLNPAPPSELSQVDVAVLDTGIRNVTGDTELNVATSGIDCAKDDLQGKHTRAAWADVDTFNGHGTHVSGTIGAKNTGSGIVGVAPGVKLFAVRIFSSQGGVITGDTETVACGVDWVARTRISGHEPYGSSPIDVANMSIQGPIAPGDGAACPSPAGSGDAEHAAICSASDLGVTFVVAAGNSSRNAALTVPAAYDSVITVSALSDYDGKAGALATSGCSHEPDDSFASYSNYGAPVDLIAPGSCIKSLGLTAGATHDLSGTSMATPHVTGAAARYVAVLIHNGATAHDSSEINADVVRTALKASAGFDWTTGSDPDGNPDRLLDVAALQAPAPALNVWAFPSLVLSGAPSGSPSDPVDSTFSVQLQRIGVYAGDVTISADADPATGVDITPVDPVLTGLDTDGIATTLHVSVGPSAADGDVTIHVHAAADGLTTATTTLTLRVDRHKPTIDSFTAELLGGVQLESAQPVRLTWSGSDVGSGITRYELQRRVGGSSTWTAFGISPATATTSVRLVALKTDYTFRVRAFDAVGNGSDWLPLNLRIGARDSQSSSISFSSGNSWITHSNGSAYRGSYRRSTQPGAFAAASFNGRSVAWVAPVGPGKGSAKVYVDGHLVATVSLNAGHATPRKVIWTSGPLSHGSHTLVITVVSGIVDLDAILILG